MKMLICSFYDVAAVAYSRPFFTVSKGMALRMAADEVNREADDNQLAKHSADFMLFLLGEFDDSNGLIVPVCPPERLAVCSELRYRVPVSSSASDIVSPPV